MPKYTLDVKLFSTVEVDAGSLKEAIAALRAGIGSGEVCLGRWADGSPISGSAKVDDEDPDVLDVEGEGVAKCADCGGRCGENDLRTIRRLHERVLPGEPMPAGECPDCGAVCHLVEAGIGYEAAGSVGRADYGAQGRGHECTADDALEGR